MQNPNPDQVGGGGQEGQKVRTVAESAQRTATQPSRDEERLQTSVATRESPGTAEGQNPILPIAPSAPREWQEELMLRLVSGLQNVVEENFSRIQSEISSMNQRLMTVETEKQNQNLVFQLGQPKENDYLKLMHDGEETKVGSTFLVNPMVLRNHEEGQTENVGTGPTEEIPAQEEEDEASLHSAQDYSGKTGEILVGNEDASEKIDPINELLYQNREQEKKLDEKERKIQEQDDEILRLHAEVYRNRISTKGVVTKPKTEAEYEERQVTGFGIRASEFKRVKRWEEAPLDPDTDEERENQPSMAGGYQKTFYTQSGKGDPGGDGDSSSDSSSEGSHSEDSKWIQVRKKKDGTYVDAVKGRMDAARLPQVALSAPVLRSITEKDIENFKVDVERLYAMAHTDENQMPMSLMLTRDQQEKVRLNWRKALNSLNEPSKESRFNYVDDYTLKDVLSAKNRKVLKVLRFIANPNRGQAANVLEILQKKLNFYNTYEKFATTDHFERFIENTAEVITAIWHRLPSYDRSVEQKKNMPNESLQKDIVNLIYQTFKAKAGQGRLNDFQSLCSIFQDAKPHLSWRSSIRDFYSILRNQVDQENEITLKYGHLLRTAATGAPSPPARENYRNRERNQTRFQKGKTTPALTPPPPAKDPRKFVRKMGGITPADTKGSCFQCGKEGATAGHEDCTNPRPNSPNELGTRAYKAWRTYLETRSTKKLSTPPKKEEKKGPYEIKGLEEVEILPFPQGRKKKNQPVSFGKDENYFATLQEEEVEEAQEENEEEANEDDKLALDFVPDTTKHMREPRHIRVKINDKNVVALMDTGAEGAASWITEEAVKRLKLVPVRTTPKEFIGPLDADKVYKSDRAVVVTIFFPKENFQVAKVLLRIFPAAMRRRNTEITLGNDFLIEHRLLKYFTSQEPHERYGRLPPIVKVEEDDLIPDLGQIGMLSAILQRPSDQGETPESQSEQELHIPPLQSTQTQSTSALPIGADDVQNYVDENFPMRKELQARLHRNKETFVMKLEGTVAEHVPLFYVEPIKLFEGVKPRHYSEARKKFMESWIPEYLERGIIKRSNSTTTSPVHVTPKTPGVQDNRFRVTVDATKLNTCLPMMHTMLPTVTETIQSLAGYEYYSKFDLPDAYFQLPADPRMAELYAFSTHLGNFEWCNVLPQGDKNIPGHCTKVMGIVTQGLKNVRPYMDDIFVFSNTAQEHVTHVTELLARLKYHNIKLKTSKTCAGTRSLHALGFKIDKRGYTPEREQAEKFLSAPFPNKEQLRSWMGLLNVFRNFLPRVDKIEKAFATVRKKNAKWEVTPAMREAFEKAKEMVSSLPTLTFVDDQRPLILEVDASHYGTGAVLLHEHVEEKDGIAVVTKQIIRMSSHLFTPAALKWPTIEKEGFAIVKALKSFELLLLGRSFILRTDHRNLLYMGHSINLRVQRWYAYVSRFDLTIEHIPGVENVISDALSRIFRQTYADAPDNMRELNEITLRHEPQHLPLDVIAAIEDGDDKHDKAPFPLLGSMINHVQNPIPPTLLRPWDEFENHKFLQQLFENLGNFLFDKFSTTEEGKAPHILAQFVEDNPKDPVEPTMAVVPEGKHTPPLAEEVLREFFKRFHCAATGHLGLNETITAIENLVGSKPLGLRQAVIREIAACAPCAKDRLERKQARYERHSLSGRRPFHTVQVDILTGFPTSALGNNRILVVVDTFTRYCVLIPLPDETAQSICYAFLNVYGMFGTISRLVSDGGPAFISEGWSQFLQTLGIHHEVTQPHLPQSHGIVERQHRNLLSVARKVFLDLKELSEENWDRYLPLVQRIMNSHETVATGFAPATMLFGSTMVVDQKLLLENQPAETHQNPQEYLRVLDDLIKTMRYEGLTVTEDLAVNNYEKSPDTSKQFLAGEYVIYKNFLSVTGRLGKLSPRYVGPALVIDHLADDFYKLKDIVQDVEIFAHARHLMKFNRRGYSDEELLNMACADYLEHTIHYIVGHEVVDVEKALTPGNLRFTVAFQTDLRGHEGHPGLLWRDLKHVQAFKDYIQRHLKSMVKYLPPMTTEVQRRPYARIKAAARLRAGT